MTDTTGTGTTGTGTAGAQAPEWQLRTAKTDKPITKTMRDLPKWQRGTGSPPPAPSVGYPPAGEPDTRPPAAPATATAMTDARDAPDAPAPTLDAPSASAFPKFFGNAQYTCSPGGASDMGLAVGRHPDRPVMQVNNYGVGLFSSTGRSPDRDAYPKNLCALFDSGATFDPRAFFDWEYGRYVIVAAETMADGRTMIAVSATDDPAGDYFVYRLPRLSGTDKTFPDFPRVGHDRRAIYIASNIFTHGKPRQYFHEEWLLLPKAELYKGAAFAFNYIYATKIGGVTSDGSQPASVWNPKEDPGPALFIGSTSLNANVFDGIIRCTAQNPCDELNVWAVADPLGAQPIVTAVTVKTKTKYSAPPPVAWQKTFWSNTSSGDTAISGTVSYAAGSLYASLTTRVGDGNHARAAAILYTVRPELTGSRLTGATITKEIVLAFPQDSTFFATTQSDAEGAVISVFNVAGETHFPSVYCYVHSKNVSLLVQEGESNFNPPRGLGDYTAVAPQILDGGKVACWFSGQYTRRDNQIEWFTVVGRYEP